jgi:xanthine/uracil/vitamin C permease (AzgA family)
LARVHARTHRGSAGRVLAGTYTCDIDPGFAPGWQGGGIMESPTTWLGIFGVIIITILLIKKQTASFAIITGVVFVSVLSWFKNSEVSFFEADILPVRARLNHAFVIQPYLLRI